MPARAAFASSSRGVWVGWGPEIRASKPSAGDDILWFYDPGFFGLNAHPWRGYSRWELVSRSDFVRNLRAWTRDSELLSSFEQKPLLARNFGEQFARAKEAFDSGHLEKIVGYCVAEWGIQSSTHTGIPFRLGESSAGQVDPWLSSEMWMYGSWNPEGGFVGLTPEILVRGVRHQDQWNLQSMALAGTAPLDRADDLLTSAKNLAEHAFVSDSLQARVSSMGRVQRRGPEVVKFPGLAHLKTSFEWMCEGTEFSGASLMESLTERLHPTPALGFAPTRAQTGRELLNQWERAQTRHDLGAPWGVLAPDHLDFEILVAIRKVDWTRSALFVVSGCGLVAASELNQEWDELALKRKSVLSLMGLTGASGA